MAMTPPEQLTFDLPFRAARGRDAFFVSPANAIAVAQIDDWANWPAGKLALTGPTGAGKTHLAHVWASESGAGILSATALPDPPEGGVFVVEDIPDIAGNAAAQVALFHFHNSVLAHGGKLLLTGRGAAGRWKLALPDLASRMAGTASVHLEPPDDALLAALLVKLFNDRQLAPSAEVIRFLLPRMERSFVAAGGLVDAIDRAALSSGHKIGLRLAAQVLDKMGDTAR
ncbi:MAG: chromosomal replication initiation ATPase DnaA [Paracoccaceae bacterium]|jgi:chromosomal replication initiation ATPase DnaA